MPAFLLSFVFSTLSMAAQPLGCFEAAPGLAKGPRAAAFEANHRDFPSYCAEEADWRRLKRAHDPLVARMQKFVSRNNFCFAIVKGFANEVYSVPDWPSLSVYMKESEDVIQRLRTMDNPVGAVTPYTKPFEPDMSSAQDTKNAAISLLEQLIDYRQNPPWKDVPGFSGQKCEHFILHCHSKGGATCYNLAADDVLDAKPGLREFAADHVSLALIENGVVAGGAPVADIAVSFCEESSVCLAKLQEDPVARAIYESIRGGREERLRLRQAWEKFKAGREDDKDTFLERLFLVHDEKIADTVDLLTKSGMMSLTSSFVSARQRAVRSSSGPMRDRLYFGSSFKDPSDYDPSNPRRILAEFQSSPLVNKPGDGLVPCEGQVDSQVGQWLIDTKNMWHMESNAFGPVSGSKATCRLGYARRLWINVMEEATRMGIFPPAKSTKKP